MNKNERPEDKTNKVGEKREVEKIQLQKRGGGKGQESKDDKLMKEQPCNGKIKGKEKS